ncbi:class I SAM-dependent methyltransferase [Chloroflexota bacterium]
MNQVKKELKTLANKDQRSHGSKDKFSEIWETSLKTADSRDLQRFTAGHPKTQMQLVYRRHWLMIKELLQNRMGKCLEVGCGTGAISAYLANDGYDCTLLDSSPTAITVAQSNFGRHDLKGTFVVGDVENLPFESDSFDFIFSIGLMEHFDDVVSSLQEQIKLIKPGGEFLAIIAPKKRFDILYYIEHIPTYMKNVPQMPKSIIRKLKPKSFRKIRTKIRTNLNGDTAGIPGGVFRSTFFNDQYESILMQNGLSHICSFWIAPIPHIQPIPGFLDHLLVLTFEAILLLRRILFRRNPWIASKFLSRGFIIHASKLLTATDMPKSLKEYKN